MRQAWMVSVLVMIAAAAPPAAAQTIPLPAAEAAGLIGKVGFFEGLVAGVRIGARGTITLDLERRSPRAALSVVVPEVIASQIAGLAKWTGRRVVIRGRVQRIDGRLQITVEAAAELAIAEQPTRIPCD